MALSFGTVLKGTFGRKRMHICDVTHDGSATAITAANLELHYIDHAFASPNTVPVGSAGTTTQVDLTTNSGTGVAFSALSSGAITTIIAIGT